MGMLYEYCARVQKEIEAKGLDMYKTRGAIAMKTGFLITLVDPDDADDPTRIRDLRDAAWDVLGLRLG